MAKHRFYLPAERWNPESLVLEGEEAHHCLDVMRCREGDCVVVFNGAGTEAEAEITATSRGSVTLSARIVVTTPRPPAAFSRQCAPTCGARRPATSDIGVSSGSPPVGDVTVS